MTQQIEARLDALIDTLRTVRAVMFFRDYWKDSMPDKLVKIIEEAIAEEERMRIACPFDKPSRDELATTAQQIALGIGGAK